MVGADAESISVHNGVVEIKSLLKRHIRKIRSHEKFKYSTIVFIPENNLGWEGSHMDHTLRDEPNVVTLREKGPQGRPGIRKDAMKSEKYPLFVKDCLVEGNLYFEQTLFTVTKNKVGSMMKSELRAQLERVGQDVIGKNGANPNKRTKMTIHGKRNGKQDDLYITLAMCLYWGRWYLKNKMLGVV